MDIILHGDIATPLLLKGTKHFVVYNNAGVLAAPQNFTLADADLVTKLSNGALKLAVVNSDIFEVSNLNGKRTLLIRGATASTPALLINSYSNVDLPSAADAVTYSPNNFIGISDRNVQLQIRDINGDGLNDIFLADSSSEYAYLNDINSIPNRYFEVTASTSKPIVDATHVGTTAGQFRVDESGAATYSIPINVPDGIAGVKPQISLNYSSNAGSGIAGRGWSLGGLSAISRCRQTLSQDNNPQPITWSANDRFCLDGQRLIVASGTYGSVGSTYKTEIDSVVEVKALGGSAGHPTYFEVRAKDGSVSTYGNTSTSKLSGSTTNPNTTVLSWAINRFEDNMHNAIEYVYEGDAVSGQRIKYISYAFDIYAHAQAKLEFAYSSRSDTSSAYVAGYAFSQTQRLQTIKVLNSSPGSFDELRSYNLNYLPNAAPNTGDNRGIENITRLDTVQECRGGACYAPTQFGWGGGTKIIFDPKIDKLSINSGTDTKPLLQKIFADVTGDGRQDLVYVVLDNLINSSGKATVALYTRYADDAVATSVHRIATYTVDRYQSIKLQNFDFNADGRQDVAFYDGTKWYLYKSQPSTTNKIWGLSWRIVDLSITQFNAIFADVNSDGLTDVVVPDGYYPLKPDPQKLITSDQYYALSNKVTFQLDPSNVYTELAGGYVNTEPNISNCTTQPDISFKIKNSSGADFNGDGVTDFIATVTYSYQCTDNNIQNYNPIVTRSRSATYAFVLKENNLVKYGGSAPVTTEAMDLNGDGLSDLVINIVSAYSYRINTGNGFTSVTPWYTLPSYSTDPTITVPQFIDYNGDGLVDLFWHDRQQGKLKVLLWNTSTPMILAGASTLSTTQYMLADVSGDGVQDLIGFHANTNSITATYGQYATDTGALGCNLYGSLESGECLSWSPSTLPEVQTRQNLNITAITNGTGSVTNIHYGTLSNSGRYATMDVDPTLVTTGTPEQCYNNEYGYIDYCSGGYTYSFDLTRFYSRLNGGWDLPTGSATLSPGNISKGNPVLEINGSMMIVTAVESNAPAAGSSAYNIDQQAMSKVDYYYGEAKMQASGRGFLGFGKLTTVDAQTDVKTVSFYRQDFPFIGSPLSTTVYSNSSTTAKILSHSFNKWNFTPKDGADGTKYYLPWLDESTEKTYDADDNANPILQTIFIKNIYDDYGNLLNATSTTSGSGISSTQNVLNTYGSTNDEKRYGRLTQAQVTTSRDGASAVTKTSNFTYYDKNGDYKFLLKSEEIVGGPKTTYYYDLFGNKTQVSVEAKNSLDVNETRNTFNTYSTDGRYLVSTKNDLDQSAKITSRNEYGQTVNAEDANGVSSGTTYYDAMGNQYMQKNADGSWTRTESRWCNSANGISCPTGAVYRIYSRASGGSKAYEYFDKLGRSIRSSKLNFNGASWSIVDTEYDNLSRVKRQSNPFTSSVPHSGTATAWTVTEFDNFGRPTKIKTPYVAANDSESTITYSGYSTTTTNALGQTKTETKNGLGQLVKVEDNGVTVNNQLQKGTIEYEYDVYGGLLKATTTAVDVAKPFSVRMCYDNLGRKTAMLDPDKGGTRAASGDATIACDPAVTYGRAGWWTYKYNGFGELQEQSDPKGQRTQMHYDKLGRMIGRIDVKANGSIESFTQWFYEKDVSAQSTGINGKLTAVVMNTATGITQSQINTALTNGTASCTEGNACFKTVYEFDIYTRPTNTKTWYPGSTTAYTSWIEYDPIIGRVLKQFDPLDQQLTENGNKVISGTQTTYNDFGYVSSVRDIGSGQLISAITETNARGQVTKELRGNGALTQNTYDDLTGQLTNQQAGNGSVFSIQNISYKWDKIGNLKYRKNNSPFIGGSGNKNKQESFCYDDLNRLIKTVANVSADYATGNSACSSQDITYDGFGNIKSKVGVGNYTYSGVNVGPHAVTTAGAATYTYDANGNAISGDGRTFDYTSYDMAAKISKSSTHYTEFKYGPDRARWYREDVKSGNATIKTTYIGNIEKIETVGGDIEWKRYVGGAIFTYKTNTTNQVQSKDKAWVYNDHLGSVDVITDNAGTIRQSLSFTPWGERRSGENWSAMTAAQISTALVPSGYSRPITTRGYTGHEMVDDMGIIHMNGRIYDAKIGRFLQADPFIQAAGDTQSYNRYSYVRNNPLNATDPSGYNWLKKAWNKVRPFVGIIVATVLTVFAPEGAGLWYATFVGAASGAAGAAANGGNILQGAFTGAVSAAAFYGVGKYFSKVGGQTCRAGTYNFGGNYLTSGEIAGQIASHAMTGGVLAELQGGKFGSGFISAGFTKGVTGSGITNMGSGSGALVGETFAAAVVGGTVSEMTGGKFSSGAQTAAFAYLFNQTMSELRTMAAYRSMADQYRASQTQMNRYAPIPRVPGTIYITGHRVGIFGPYHTAIEYDDGNGARWISGGPEGYGFEGHKYLVGGIGDGINGIRPTDMPALNILIGEVQPPSGMSSGDYFNSLMSAANAYNSSIDYDLFPGISNSYNSNSYVAGLIQATGGASNVNLSDYVGGSKPLPKSNFGY